MWQLSWMLSFIPDIFWTLSLYGSLAAFAATYVLKFIKPLVIYANIIRPVAALIAFLSVYWQGGIDVENKWQARVKEMEAKVAAAQAESAAVNRGLETKVITKTKIIKEKGDAIVQYVDRVVTQDKEVIKFVENCPIPPVIIDTLNSAAKNQPMGEKK